MRDDAEITKQHRARGSLHPVEVVASQPPRRDSSSYLFGGLSVGAVALWAWLLAPMATGAATASGIAQAQMRSSQPSALRVAPSTGVAPGASERAFDESQPDAVEVAPRVAPMATSNTAKGTAGHPISESTAADSAAPSGERAKSASAKPEPAKSRSAESSSFCSDGVSQGTATVSVTYDNAGKPTGVIRLSAADALSPKVQTCILNAMQGTRVAPYEGKLKTVSRTVQISP